MKSSCDFSTILGEKHIVKNIKHFIPNSPHFLLPRVLFVGELFLQKPSHTPGWANDSLSFVPMWSPEFILYTFHVCVFFFSSANNLFTCWSSLQRLYIHLLRAHMFFCLIISDA